MKKLISLLAAVVLLCIFCTGGASALWSAATWEKSYYLDPFGDATENYYLGMTKRASGSYKSGSVTDGVLERTSIYLVEKGEPRLLYATDTGGIMGDAARMIGIDPHIKEKNFERFAKSAPYVHKPQALTAFIMEATDIDLDEDFRLFVHSSVQTVSRIVNMLVKNDRLKLPPGQHVYLTHLGLGDKYRGWPSEKINAELPAPLNAAYDGLELVLG